MHDESFNDFWRQKVLLVRGQLAEQVNFQLAVAVFVWQFRQLHHEHEAQERQLLILVVKNQQRQQVLLQEVPVAERCPHEGLRLIVKFQVLEEFFETLFAVLTLDVDIKATNLLDAADALHPEEQLIFLLSLLLLGHLLWLVVIVVDESILL